MKLDITGEDDGFEMRDITTGDSCVRIMYIVPVTSILSWRNDFDILSKPAKYSDI